MNIVTCNFSNDEIVRRYNNPFTQCCDPKCKSKEHQRSEEHPLVQQNAQTFTSQSSARFYSLGSKVALKNDTVAHPSTVRHFYKNQLTNVSVGILVNAQEPKASMASVPKLVMVSKVLLNLPLKDLISFGLTCKKYRELSERDVFWKGFHLYLKTSTYLTMRIYGEISNTEDFLSSIRNYKIEWDSAKSVGFEKECKNFLACLYERFRISLEEELLPLTLTPVELEKEVERLKSYIW